MALRPGDELDHASFVGMGPMSLSGVDYEKVRTKRQYGDDSEANAIKFCLDGVTYMAVEDEDDGYRSALRHVIVTDSAPKNLFPAVVVVARQSGKDSDITELVSQETDKVVLEFGTDHSDDYYPATLACSIPKQCRSMRQRLFRSAKKSATMPIGALGRKHCFLSSTITIHISQQ